MVRLFSFRNLIATLIDEVNATSSVMGKIISLGKELLSKRKKKKKVRRTAGKA